MTPRKYVIRQAAALMTSPRLRNMRRAWFEFRRKLRLRPRAIEVFLRAADPYSYLLLCALPDFIREQKLEVRLRTVQDLPADMVPRPDLLEAYARLDVQRMARMHGFDFPEVIRVPAADLVRAATALLVQCEAEPGLSGIDRAIRTLRALWKNDREFFAKLPGTDGKLNEARKIILRENEKRLVRLGHYNSAMIYYGGEWYWGLDRLCHLEKRLAGVSRSASDARPFTPARSASSGRIPARAPKNERAGSQAIRSQTCDFYFSFRSPYSYLALERTFAFADRHELKLNIKLVLPMVMRGLAVPRAKRFYILKDAAREAERYGIPFGWICDPVGVGVERCMAGFACATKHNREREYLLSAARMIWSEGGDVANRRGLSAVVERAGLDWSEFQTYLSDESWRSIAEQNQTDLFELGLWGVPVFRIGDTIVWGQDRFDFLESVMRR